MTDTGFQPPAALRARIAATEPAGGQPKTGIVHDENAEALGGVAGHAALFGTVADLGRYAAAWAAPPGAVSGLDLIGVPGWLRADALRCQTGELADQEPPARRGLGWGLRGDQWDNMGPGWPAGGAGHTGFTGTSLSVDPASGMWAVLCTNAVHYGRGPEHSVKALRMQVHGLIAATLLGSVVQ